MRVPRQRVGEPLEVKMTPMIDVVFLLLIFFIWTSSFREPEFDLPSSLAQVPEAGTESTTRQPPPAEVFDEIVIRLISADDDVEIRLNGQAVESLEVLGRRLAGILELGVQPPVIIDPDEEVTMGLAVQAYDASRLAGADRVLFAARE